MNPPNPAQESARLPSPPKARILAIEPDRGRARVLTGLLRDRLRATVEIVRTTGEAIQSISERVPDLVLTSTLFPPSDEAALIAQLKQLPGASHVQVIVVPAFTAEQQSPSPDTSRMFGLLRSRSAHPVTACDLAAVRETIEQYLEQARSAVEFPGDVLRALPGAELIDDGMQRYRVPSIQLIRSRMGTDVNSLGSGFAHRAERLGCAHASDRRRSRRRSRAEFPGLWSIQLPGGADLGVVDLSSSGVLGETATRPARGATLDLRVVGVETDFYIPARVLRTEVARVDPRGVRYQVAAAFARELDLATLGSAPRPAAAPRALLDLLAHVMGDGTSDEGSAAPLESFEQGLRRLLPVRDIRIRQQPAAIAGCDESIYFTIPAGQRPVLQATFDYGYEPSALEFRLLSAAAKLAAVLLECSPRDDARRFSTSPSALSTGTEGRRR